MNELAKVKAAFAFAIDFLGLPAVLTEATVRSATPTHTFRVGFNAVNIQDEALVNSYGINAKVITMKASEGYKPKKFDSIVVNGQKYFVDGTQEISVGGEIIGYKMYCKEHMR
jgi:CRISPR/Cas system CMR-associated protein Cmr3 (group 5 of RAMP superfamily)